MSYINKDKDDKVTGFKVTEPDKLMEFLMKKMSGISRTKVKKILSSGQIKIGDEVITQFDYALQPGVTVCMGKPVDKKRFSSRKIRIVFEDQYLFVIEKSVGVLSNSSNPDEDSAQHELNAYLEMTHQRCRAHTIHRLDRDTSGLMLFAKDKKIAMMFEQDWKSTVYDRRYVALVHGMMLQKEGTISSWLKDNKMFVTYSSSTDNGGKYAVTHYEVKQMRKGFSLVELQLETGRKNQIRVHLQDIGFPVVGDPKYGDGSDTIGRLGLHAYKLCFIHPITGENLEFETPIPNSFYLR